MEFNINQTAKVKLSGYGIEILMKQHYESQLWMIMETFGGGNMGISKQPFDSQIILESR